MGSEMDCKYAKQIQSSLLPFKFQTALLRQLSGIHAIGTQTADPAIRIGAGEPLLTSAWTAQGAAVVACAEAVISKRPQPVHQAEYSSIVGISGMSDGGLICVVLNFPNCFYNQNLLLSQKRLTHILRLTAGRWTGIIAPIIAAEVLLTVGTKVRVHWNFFWPEQCGMKTRFFGKLHHGVFCHQRHLFFAWKQESAA